MNDNSYYCSYYYPDGPVATFLHSYEDCRLLAHCAVEDGTDCYMVEVRSYPNNEVVLTVTEMWEG